MPYQIKNGIVYGSNAVSLTQAQYDALSTAEKNNGTVYYIYDSEAVLDASDVSLGSGTVEGLAGSVAVIETSPTTATHAVGSYIVYNGQLYEVTAAIAVGETLTVDTNIEATSVGTELTQLNNGLTQLGKIYRFNVSSGAVAINARMPFVKSYSLDDSIYADGTSIKFTRPGIVRIDLNVNAQTSNRLWLTIHGNVNHQFITYGTYVTCNSSIVVQVDTSYEFYITAKEACTINGGGTDPSTIFFTWMG